MIKAVAAISETSQVFGENDTPAHQDRLGGGVVHGTDGPLPPGRRVKGVLIPGGAQPGPRVLRWAG